MTDLPPDRPLIPRTSLFGAPSRRSASVSPSAGWLAWIAPLDGVPNIWIAPMDDREAARPLTRDTGRGIQGFGWSYDDRFVLYAQDRGGDEQHHVYAVPVEGGEARDLTPFGRAKCGIARISRTRRGEVLVTSNARNPKFPDLLVVDLSTGAATVVEENDRFANFVCDDDFVPRVAREARRDGAIDLFRRVDGEWTVFETIAADDARTTFPLGLDASGNSLFINDTGGRDTAALYEIDLASGRRRLIAEDDRADISGIIADPVTYRPMAYTVVYEREERHVLDEAIRPTIEFLDAQAIGDWNVTSRSEDDRWWTVGASADVDPGSTYLFDRESMQLTKLYSVRPELEHAPLSHMYPTVIAARDGLAMVSYLTLPAPVDRGGIEAGIAAPGPLVLLVHGGPWARDRYGYQPQAQWLADRGYAVLCVNFRGSSGFGKRHLLAGNGEWGGRMDEDLDDALAWAIERGFADPARVAIMGGSYGGYATLSALTTRPEQYACGIDIVGPANLQTLIDATPAWWESERAFLHRAVGDPDTEEGRAHLKDRSPLSHASRLVRPLLIGQGANDPRVPRAEADQIADALRANGGTPNYVLFPDEGHGFVRPPNNVAFQAVAEAFLAEHLGGRAEPPSLAEVRGHAMQVIDGEPWLMAIVEELGAETGQNVRQAAMQD